MSKPGFKDVDFSKPAGQPQGQIHTPPDSPEKKYRPMELPLHKTKERGSNAAHVRPDSRGNAANAHGRNTSWGGLEGALAVPLSPSSHNTIEVPALRSPDADSTQFMHNLSATPSMKERRVSRNSFGTSLPIPKSKRQSRLSAVAYPEGHEALKTGAGAIPIQAIKKIERGSAWACISTNPRNRPLPPI